MPERPALVAAAAFGHLRAPQVAAAVGRGLERAGLRPPDLCPLAAGGPGTLEVLLTALGGETAGIRVGEVAAGFALIEGGGTAIVETHESPAVTEALLRVASEHADVVLVAGDPTPVTEGPGPFVRPDLRLVLDAVDFDARMRAARCLVLAAPALEPSSLPGGTAGEVATRARQAGVPAYAITGRNALDPFAARIVDLQRILVASTPDELEAAGEELGGEI